MKETSDDLLTPDELRKLNDLEAKFEIDYLTRNSIAVLFGWKFVGEIDVESFRKTVIEFLPKSEPQESTEIP